MYLKIGDGTFHQGSVIGVKKTKTTSGIPAARVFLAVGDGDVVETTVEFDSDADAREEVEDIHETLKTDAKERLEKRRSQMQMSGGGSNPFA